MSYLTPELSRPFSATFYPLLNRLTLVLWALVLAATLWGLAPSARAQAPAKPAPEKGVLRVGIQKVALMLAMRESKALENALAPLGYKVAWYDMPSGLALMEAMRAGNIDYGLNGLPTFYGIERGVDFKYLGGYREPGSAEGIVVRKDSPIRTIKDLKGKRIAYTKGSIAEHMIWLMLKSEGLSVKDIEHRNIPNADANLALINGSIDAWATWSPFHNVASRHAELRLLRDGGEFGANFHVHILSTEFAKKHPDVVEPLVKVIRKTWADVVANPQPTAQLLAKSTKLDPAIWHEIIVAQDVPWEYMDRGPAQRFQKTADEFYEMGLLKKKIAIADYIWASGDAK